MNSKRDSLIDILKGIGIVSVVVGHSGVLFPGGGWLPSIKFVYSYHLMVFFFAAGAVYSPKKYTDPFTYMGRQLKGSIPLYWAYNFAFLALHNVFSSCGLLDIPMFTVNNFAISTAGILTLTHSEQLAGALWFVPMLLVGKMLFAVGYQWAEKRKYKVMAHICVVIAFAAFGLYTNHWGMYFSYHVQTAFLGIPIIYLGVLFKQYRNQINRVLNPITCIVRAALLLWFIELDIGYVELSINQIISPWLFYPVTILGLIFAISLAALTQRITVATKLFAYLGAISFHIMALHFFAFKGFDWVYSLFKEVDPAVTMKFPYSLDNIGLFYSVIGIALPVCLVYIFRKYLLAPKKCLRENE